MVRNPSKGIIFAVLLVFIVIAFLLLGFIKESVGNRYTVTNNGNFLFYNSPVAAKYREYIFVAFVTKEGHVLVKKYKDKSFDFIESYDVHDYSEISQNTAGADDHAAPAIIYNEIRNEILLVTSYHGSDLYIYKYDSNENQFNLYKKLVGRFTYPRLISYVDNFYILIRAQPSGGLKGDLVVISSVDDFTSEFMVVPSQEGEVIYGSRPSLAGNAILITYSTYHYSNRQLRDWKLAKFDLNEMKLENTFDMGGNLDASYFSNRPTAVVSVRGNILVGTAMTFDEVGIDESYKSINKILIIEIDSKTGALIDKIHENVVLAPYYPTSLDINESGDYIYFGESGTFFSKNISDSCFRRGASKMYPNFFGNDIFYVTRNGSSYSIRGFDNSIIFCDNLD